MKSEDLQLYLSSMAECVALDRYVERRFAASETGRMPGDTDLRFRGMLRDREPKLTDVLTHSRVLILAEPGGGKSVVGKAAVHQFIRLRVRVPIFAELKEYRGDLAALIAKAAPLGSRWRFQSRSML